MGVPPGVDIRAVCEEEVRHVEVMTEKAERHVENLLPLAPEECEGAFAE